MLLSFQVGILATAEKTINIRHLYVASSKAAAVGIQVLSLHPYTQHIGPADAWPDFLTL